MSIPLYCELQITNIVSKSFISICYCQIWSSLKLISNSHQLACCTCFILFYISAPDIVVQVSVSETCAGCWLYLHAEVGYAFAVYCRNGHSTRSRQHHPTALSNDDAVPKIRGRIYGRRYRAYAQCIRTSGSQILVGDGKCYLEVVAGWCRCAQVRALTRRVVFDVYLEANSSRQGLD
jgi:hypothetical protein